MEPQSGEPKAEPKQPPEADLRSGQDRDHNSDPSKEGDATVAITNREAETQQLDHHRPNPGGNGVENRSDRVDDKLDMNSGSRSQKSVQWSQELVESRSSTAPSFIESLITARNVLGRWGRRVKEATRMAEDFAGNTWQHLKTAPSFTDAALGRIAQGTKILAEGGYEKVFRQTFETVPEEQLQSSYACYLSTTVGPVMGILYVSTAKLAFCSDNPIPYKDGGKTEWSYYQGRWRGTLGSHHVQCVRWLRRGSFGIPCSWHTSSAGLPEPPKGKEGGGGRGSRDFEEQEEIANSTTDTDSNNNAVNKAPKKRFRTRFSREQREKMLGLAEEIGWRTRKEHKEAMCQLCEEIGVTPHVFKVWVKNNKTTLRKKP